MSLEVSAAAAVPGLARSDPHGPGISRAKVGEGFEYRDPSGADVTDAETVLRIRALAIPPAWTGVWISPDPLGHIQATGVDGRGRTQYRYHQLWREQRDAQKFAHMLRIGGEKYAELDHHYGATTLEKRHVHVTRGALTFDYIAKEGKHRAVSITDE